MADLLKDINRIKEPKKTRKMIYRTEVHWISYVFPIILIILGVLLIGFIIPIIFIIRGVSSLLINSSISIYLYENQLTVRSGVFSTRITDIALNKYEGLNLHQSALGNLLNYGTLHVTTGGVSQRYKIKKPLELRKYIIN